MDEVRHLDGVAILGLDHDGLLCDQAFEYRGVLLVACEECLVRKAQDAVAQMVVEVTDQVPCIGDVNSVLAEHLFDPAGEEAFAGPATTANDEGDLALPVGVLD